MDPGGGLNGDIGPNGASVVELTPEEIQALAECIFAALNDGAATPIVQQSTQQQSMESTTTNRNNHNK